MQPDSIQDDIIMYFLGDRNERRRKRSRGKGRCGVKTCFRLNYYYCYLHSLLLDINNECTSGGMVTKKKKKKRHSLEAGMHYNQSPPPILLL